VRIRYEVRERIATPLIGLALLTPRNERVFLTQTLDTGDHIAALEKSGAIDCVIERPNLLPGQYHFEVWISDPQDHAHANFADHLRLVGTLELVPGERFDGNSAVLSGGDRGRVFIETRWSPA
jgi:hypothetical protein